MWGMRTLAEQGHIRIEWMRSGISITAYAKKISLARAVANKIEESVKNKSKDNDG